jgi:hypothetical protein
VHLYFCLMLIEGNPTEFLHSSSRQRRKCTSFGCRYAFNYAFQCAFPKISNAQDPNKDKDDELVRKINIKINGEAEAAAPPTNVHALDQASLLALIEVFP